MEVTIPGDKAIAKRVTTLETQVKSLSVVDQTTYEQAGELLKSVNAGIKKAMEVLDPPVKSAYAHALAMANHKNKYINPLQEAKVTISKAMSDWLTMMENRRLEEERKAREEADRQEAEERLRLQEASDIAAEEGDEELAIDLEMQAATVFVPTVSEAPAPAKVSGIATIDDYEVEIIDMVKFLRAVMSKKVRLDLNTICKIRVDLVKTYVRNSKHFDIPGTKVKKIKIARGTGR